MSDTAPQDHPSTQPAPVPEAPTPPTPLTPETPPAGVPAPPVPAPVPPTEPAPGEPDADDEPKKATSSIGLGTLVTYTYADPYSGEDRTLHGIVIAEHPDEGAGARNSVAWLEDVSGPIGAEQLVAI